MSRTTRALEIVVRGIGLASSRAYACGFAKLKYIKKNNIIIYNNNKLVYIVIIYYLL